MQLIHMRKDALLYCQVKKSKMKTSIYSSIPLFKILYICICIENGREGYKTLTVLVSGE